MNLEPLCSQRLFKLRENYSQTGLEPEYAWSLVRIQPGPPLATNCLAQLIFGIVSLNMYNPTRLQRIENLNSAISDLSDRQLNIIAPIIQQLSTAYIEIYKSPISDLINDSILIDLGDSIRIHHCLSRGSFTKDKFEYALETALRTTGRTVQLAPPGIPGYDLVFDCKKFSLKTEAEKSIKHDLIHISKQMELGKGEWNLELLRNQFLDNLNKTDRILTLRCLSHLCAYEYYELVEIPKSLLQKSTAGILRVMVNSKQTPKPGYCDVFDNGLLQFQLYFDAGGERKLQIKNLHKSNCIIHAYWKFGKSRFANSNDQIPPF